MNKKNIFIYLLMTLPLLMTSCLKDQEDLFSDSASARTAKYLDKVKKVLTSSENGWTLNYFPDRFQSYGGYSYSLKFDDKQVTACCELAIDVTETITSYYTLNNEDGPVLMFDTYNEFLHFFSTPTGSSGPGGYEAYDGDFIFIVMNISEDENVITLKGNRTGNIMYMYRQEKSITDYQKDLESFKTDMVFEKAAGVIGGAQDTLLINSNTRSIKFQTPDSLIESTFCFEADGIALYKPIEVSGKTVNFLTYDKTQDAFVSKDDAEVVFKGLILPSIVINNVGSAITTSNAAATFTYTFNLADKFTYTSDSEWLSVSASGKTLTVNVSENTTGTPRAGFITVEANGVTDVIAVTQIEVGSLVGNYLFTCLDSENKPFSSKATVTKDTDGENGYTLTFYYPNESYPQTIKMTWNEAESHFEMASGQTLGVIGQYYSFLCFTDAEFEMWSSTSKDGVGYIIPQLTADGQVVLTVGGTFSSFQIGGLCILVGNDPEIEKMLGYYDVFMNIAIIKQ